jgi:hypothetical protein
MGAMQRRKGAAAEREWAAYCRDHYLLAHSRRTAQRMGAPDSNDVVSWPGTFCEVKRVEKLNIEDAVKQAEADCVGGAWVGELNGVAVSLPVRTAIPYVAHRRNRTDWLVTLRAADLLEFCRRVLASQEQSSRGDAAQQEK